MIKCNFVLFQKAAIKFYSCFSTTITQAWSNTMIRHFDRINFLIRQSFRFSLINVTAITNTSNPFKISAHWLKY